MKHSETVPLPQHHQGPFELLMCSYVQVLFSPEASDDAVSLFSEREHPSHPWRCPADSPSPPLSAWSVLPGPLRPCPDLLRVKLLPLHHLARCNSGISCGRGSRTWPTCMFGCLKAALTISAYIDYEFISVSLWNMFDFICATTVRSVVTLKRLFF